MPRKQDPIATLRAHERRAAELEEKGEALRDEACRYLGRLVMEAGLDAWDPAELKQAFNTLAETGNRAQQDRV